MGCDAVSTIPGATSVTSWKFVNFTWACFWTAFAQSPTSFGCAGRRRSTICPSEP